MKRLAAFIKSMIIPRRWKYRQYYKSSEARKPDLSNTHLPIRALGSAYPAVLIYPHFSCHRLRFHGRLCDCLRCLYKETVWLEDDGNSHTLVKWAFRRQNQNGDFHSRNTSQLKDINDNNKVSCKSQYVERTLVEVDS